MQAAKVVLSQTLFPRAQAAKVLGGERADVVEEFNLKPPDVVRPNVDIEEHDRAGVQLRAGWHLRGGVVTGKVIVVHPVPCRCWRSECVLEEVLGTSIAPAVRDARVYLQLLPRTNVTVVNKSNLSR